MSCVVSGGRLLVLGGDVVEVGPVPQGSFNPLGINFAAGGAATLTYEGFPVFQDMFRCGRWINNITGSLASTGILTVTATLNSSACIVLGTVLGGAGVPGRTVILTQLTGTANGLGTYQTTSSGTTLGSQAMSLAGQGGNSPTVPLDTNGWPTTDFQFLLWEGHTALSWQTAGTGKFACGFTSKGTGGETITGAGNCTISNKQYTGGTGGVVTFDLQINTPGTGGAVNFTVTGTTGGVTKIFCWLPGYRASSYSASTLITTEAFTNYSTFGWLRGMFLLNAWFDLGYLLCFTTSVTGTSATLNTGFPFAAGTYICAFNCALGSNPDVRSITISTTGQTFISWTGALANASIGIFLQKSAANRNTAANTHCLNGWSGSGFSTEGYPAEWLIDICVLCGNSPYICGPANEDGTWSQAVDTYAAATLPTNRKYHREFGNEMWNGGNFSGAPIALTIMAAFNGLTTYNYLATLLHTLAGNMRTIFGTSRFNSTCYLWACWQQGANGLNFLGNVLAYFVAQGWTPSADLKILANAPYYNTTNTNFTASIANTGVMTVSAISFNVLSSAGATVSGTSVPANSVILSQLSGTPNGAGNYQLSTSGTSVGSEAMTATMPLSSTVAQLETNLSPWAPNSVLYNRLENLAVLAMHYGLVLGSYEGGWQTNNENSGLINGGAVCLDANFTAIENSHKNAIYNTTCQFYTANESGVNAIPSNLAPIDELTTSFPPTTSNSPRYASMVNYFSGFTPTKNVVNGVGSIIHGYNWADNLDTTVLGNLAIGSFTVEPFYSQGGWVPYTLNVAAPGSYNIDITWQNVSGTPTTAVWINGVQLITGVPVSNGVVRVYSGAVLRAGGNYILFGQNGTQGTSSQNQIFQIQTN